MTIIMFNSIKYLMQFLKKIIHTSKTFFLKFEYLKYDRLLKMCQRNNINKLYYRICSNIDFFFLLIIY